MTALPATTDINNYKIYKSNRLIEAKYKLTTEEQRLILACIARINPTLPVPSSITITAEEYAHAYGIKRDAAYSQLKQAADALLRRQLKINSPEEGKEIKINWVGAVVYEHRRGMISMEFSERIKPYLSQFAKGEFTSYRHLEIRNLSHQYSFRIFDMIMQFKSTTWRSITLADFRAYLGLEDSYPRFADLKKRVIIPVINELNCKTPDFEFSWEPAKKGRKIHSLIFHVKPAKQAKLPLH